MSWPLTHYHAQLGQRSCNQRVGCLLCSVVQWYGSLNKRKVRGLVPCCGQDGSSTATPHRFIQILITHLQCNIYYFQGVPRFETEKRRGETDRTFLCLYDKQWILY